MTKADEMRALADETAWDGVTRTAPPMRAAADLMDQMAEALRVSDCALGLYGCNNAHSGIRGKIRAALDAAGYEVK